MPDLYSIKQTAKIFGLRPSQLRYWTQTGFVTPTVRKQGRLFYTFRDLVGVKAAVELLASGLRIDDARPSLDSLRKTLPARVKPQSPIRVCSDGESIEVIDEEQHRSGKHQHDVVAFRLSALQTQIELALEESARELPREVIRRTLPKPFPGSIIVKPRPSTAETPEAQPKTAGPIPTRIAESESEESAPTIEVIEGSTEPHRQPSAYEAFLEGCRAEANDEMVRAESWYRRAIDAEPSMASAHTNLGNLHHERGEWEQATQAYETALDHDPSQAEARFNLGNLLDEEGDTDRAIAELRRVVSANPDFADAHYNLGLILLRVGGVTQARAHLGRYLDLDPDTEWAKRARELMKSSR